MKSNLDGYPAAVQTHTAAGRTHLAPRTGEDTSRNQARDKSLYIIYLFYVSFCQIIF